MSESSAALLVLLPALLTMPESDGDATLVPPNTSQPLLPWHDVLSYTDTPVLGSASNE